MIKLHVDMSVLLLLEVSLLIDLQKLMDFSISLFVVFVNDLLCIATLSMLVQVEASKLVSLFVGCAMNC